MLLYVDHLDTDFHSGLASVRAKSDSDIVRILQLSDIHAARLEPDAGASRDGEVNTYARKLDEVTEKWHGSFAAQRQTKFDGMIVSGDLVFARDLGLPKDSEPDATQVSRLNDAHEFSLSCLTKMFKDQVQGNEQEACLVIPGNHDILIGAKQPARSGRNHSQITSYQEKIHNYYCRNGRTNADILVAAPKLCLYETRSGVVAVFGLDSNHCVYANKLAYKHGMVSVRQLDLLEKAVREVRTHFCHKPVYLVVVLHHHLLQVRDLRMDPAQTDAATVVLQSVILDGSATIQRLQKLRVSLVLHGHMHKDFIQYISYHDRGELHRLPIIGCPSFPQPHGHPPREDRGDTGAIALTFDTDRGVVQADVINNDEPSKSRSLFLGLVSVTRVSAAEQRVWNRLDLWLTPQHPSYPFREHCRPTERTVADFKTAAQENWRDTGYALLCSGPGAPLEVTGDPADLPTKRYRLLLLLHEDKGKKHILLNNHISIRDSVFGEWDAALLPAFRNVADFFDRVRTDLVRIRDGLMVEESSDAVNRNRTLDALKAALGELSSAAEDELEAEIRELSTKEFIKFSPTDGMPQRYAYKLCIIPSLSFHRDVTGSRSQPLQHLKFINHHQAFRYDPDPAKPRAPAGYVWFPLEDWNKNDALVARNADVMTWVYDVIQAMEKARGRDTTDCLLLGQCRDPEKIDSYNISQVVAHDFNILTDKLRKVPLLYKENLFPYGKAAIKQVYLQRKGDKDSESAFIDVCLSDTSESIGKLCPSQRYVLRSGLARAASLQQQLRGRDAKHDPARLGTNEVGYLTMQRGAIEIDILPPILERVVRTETDGDGPVFLICDGNHRVAQYCWLAEDGTRLNAVLIDRPSVPYYIKQMAPEDWSAVVCHPLSTTPELAAKYTLRVPHDVSPYISDKNRENKNIPSKANRYRALFRDFSAEFKLGAQGGVHC